MFEEDWQDDWPGADSAMEEVLEHAEAMDVELRMDTVVVYALQLMCALGDKRSSEVLEGLARIDPALPGLALALVERSRRRLEHWGDLLDESGGQDKA